MDAETRARLNALNRTFYAITADEFHETRAQAWPGWQQLLGFLPAGGLRLLDVGCGNGRLGVFLGAQRGWPLVYHGMDNSGALLERARAGLSAYPHVSVQL
ncbi:MAG: class I SAM-dependent methyltransferase [Chloroflexi bacterium]|nr:class I SAM-dependent methyltransferase [Chloroflexota bacterium]